MTEVLMTEARLKEIEYRWTDNFYDCDDLKEVFAEVRRLRAALEEYGRHEEGCARAGLEFKLRAEDYPCSCGLTEALKEGLP